MRQGEREYSYPRRQARVVVPGGTGGTEFHRIWFVVQEVSCEVLNEYGDIESELFARVRWTYYTGGCRATPPGVSSYDGLIDVYDRCVMSYFTAVGLLGLSGSATYFYPRLDSSYGPCVPRWIVDSICGTPQCATNQVVT